MAMAFLKAQWRRLVLLTYDVDPALIEPHLAPGCRPDFRIDAPGRAFVSLVAMDFLDTRVLGIRFPGYVDFPEVNLRIYVRQGDRRGVTFVREFVPQRLIAAIARLTHNEPYVAVPMSSRTTETADAVRVEHELTIAGRKQRIICTGRRPAILPPADAPDTFFKEQIYGFTPGRRGTRIEYRVDHPEWRVYGDPRFELDFDFAHVYGEKWRCLSGRRPYAVTFAEGSEISVSRKLR